MQQCYFTIIPNNMLREICFSSLDLGLAGSGDLLPKGEMLLGAPPAFVELEAKDAPGHCELLISWTERHRGRSLCDSG